MFYHGSEGEFKGGSYVDSANVNEPAAESLELVKKVLSLAVLHLLNHIFGDLRETHVVRHPPDKLQKLYILHFVYSHLAVLVHIHHFCLQEEHLHHLLTHRWFRVLQLERLTHVLEYKKYDDVHEGDVVVVVPGLLGVLGKNVGNQFLKMNKDLFGRGVEVGFLPPFGGVQRSPELLQVRDQRIDAFLLVPTAFLFEHPHVVESEDQFQELGPVQRLFLCRS